MPTDQRYDKGELGALKGRGVRPLTRECGHTVTVGPAVSALLVGVPTSPRIVKQEVPTP